MIDPQGWALVPGSEPMRFVAVDASYSRQKLRVEGVAVSASPWPPVARFEARAVFAVADRHVFAVPSIDWEGAMFCTDDDLARLVHAVKVVERVLLLLAWLCAEHEKPRRYATLQDLAAVLDARALASMSPEQIDAAIKSAVETTPCALPPDNFDRLVAERAVELLRARWRP